MSFLKNIFGESPSAEVLNKEGKIKVGKNDFYGAIIDFTKAIEINPRYAEAYNNIGIVYVRCGKLKEGYKDLEDAGRLGLKEALKTLDVLKNSDTLRSFSYHSSSR